MTQVTRTKRGDCDRCGQRWLINGKCPDCDGQIDRATDPCSCATYGFHEPALPGEPDPACPVHGGPTVDSYSHAELQAALREAHDILRKLQYDDLTPEAHEAIERALKGAK